jgi:ABC-type Zn2+ transport system substrate-binding protein/surface adhesin
MKNKEQVQRINDQLYNAKLMDYFKGTVKFHPKEVSYDEYIKIAAASHEHQHSHEYAHDHEHDHEHEHEHEHDHEHEHEH